MRDSKVEGMKLPLNKILCENIVSDDGEFEEWAEESNYNYPNIIKLNTSEPWGIDKENAFNNVLNKAYKVGEVSPDDLFYVYAFGSLKYLIGVTDNLFVAKLMNFYQAFKNIGFAFEGGTYYGSDVLRVPKEGYSSFDFEEYFKDVICEERDTSNNFYKDIEVNGTKVEVLSLCNFEDGVIEHNPFDNMILDEDEKDEIEYNLGGIFTDEELEFVRRHIYPLISEDDVLLAREV